MKLNLNSFPKNTLQMWNLLNYEYKNLELSHLKNVGHKFKKNSFSLSLFFFFGDLNSSSVDSSINYLREP